ncbi:MAG: hypothetical protein Q7W56_00780 [Candidatus Latescibacteria bacterium]|nr:hypothetical protein [Candidatus Latescibacterota bacterium]
MSTRFRTFPAGQAAVRTAARLVLAAALLGAAGCSTYADRHERLRTDLAAGRFDEALAGLDEAARAQDRLANLLEKGLVLHYADRWAESNAVFEEAELLAADLYTRSVSEAVVSLVTNDGAIAYRAPPFEMALVPYFRALNYVYLGNREEAVVEARKAELHLRDYAEIARALRDGDDDDARLAALDNDAFLQYVRAMLLDWGGETNDAFIAYRQAALAYRDTEGLLGVTTPPWLGADLLRTGTALGFSAELDELRLQLPDLLPQSLPASGTGEVVLFLETGYAPRRISRAADVPIFKSEDRRDDRDAWALSLRHRYESGWDRNATIDYWLRFALPELVDEPPAVAGARVSAGTVGGQTRAVPVEDVAGRSRRFFQDAQGKIVLKTIVRALAKYAAQEQAQDKGQVAGLLVNLLGAATEQADTRNWLTLPRGISMARLALPPGTHDLRVELVDAQDRRLETREITGVGVVSGGWTFLSRRVF